MLSIYNIKDTKNFIILLDIDLQYEAIFTVLTKLMFESGGV